MPAETLRGRPVGVLIGISSSDYSSLLWASPQRYATPDNEPFVLPGNTGCIAANRLSYFFDFKGPSFTVDTACSSSLVAVHLVSSDIRFWSSGDTKTGPPDGVLTGPFWGPLDLCFIGGCRFGVVVGGGNLCRLTGGLPQASSSGGVGRRPALSDEEEPPACGRIRPLRRFCRSR